MLDSHDDRAKLHTELRSASRYVNELEARMMSAN